MLLERTLIIRWTTILIPPKILILIISPTLRIIVGEATLPS